MYVKLFSRDLNPSPCPPHFTNTYTCKLTIVPMMHSNNLHIFSLTNAGDFGG